MTANLKLKLNFLISDHPQKKEEKEKENWEKLLQTHEKHFDKFRVALKVNEIPIIAFPQENIFFHSFSFTTLCF